MEYTTKRFNYLCRVLASDYRYVKITLHRNTQMVNQFLSNEPNKINEIRTSLLKVRGKTLIFENSVYQISNISSVDLVNLSTIKPRPTYFVWLLIIGLILLLIPNNSLRVLGIAILGTLVWLFYQYRQDKLTVRYGLLMTLNAGTRNAIISKDLDFLKTVAIVLHNIMNSDELKAVNINFDQRDIDIEDKSINIDHMFGSNVVTGTVSGDVVSNI